MKISLFIVVFCFSFSLKAQVPEKANQEKLVVLTFDDAVKSHYSYVAPLLRKYGFGATFYVCEFPPDFNDSTKYMNWAQIKQLLDWGFDIGNHTWHHAHVTNFSIGQLQQEISYIDHKCDSLHIPKPVNFAYPGYAAAPQAVEVLKQLGYLTARTGGEKVYEPGRDDLFYLPSFTPVNDLAKALDAIKQAANGKVVILTIHGVPDKAHNWVSTSPEVFESYLKYLKDNNYKVISMRELLHYIPDGPFQKASWISSAYGEDSFKRPCPIFKKTFSINKKVRSAGLLITALGVYEAKLNGQRIGDAYFTPGFTNYDKRLQYQRYDVTNLLSTSNDLRVTVGEGWYRGVFRGAKPKNNYGSNAGLLLQLAITYQDGTKDTIATDNSWVCAPGPIRFSELYNGESFDANFTANDWKPVKLLDYTKNSLVGSESKPVTKHEIFKPIRIITTPKGEQVIDFGQNLAGWVKVKVNGKQGDTIRLTHAEVLDKDGNFYRGNLREAQATDIYVLHGGGEETFEPHFTYHGFRYLKVEGFKAMVNNITAIALYSDLRKTGTFSCSNPLLNRLQQNIEWSLNSNFVDIPTDCPQRSERLGWTGDAQVFAPTASFLRDTRTFYSKWLKDLASEQGTNGGVPVYIPTVQPYNATVNGAAGWGDAATIIPWTVYETYSDTAILKDQYESMKAWVEYIKANSPNYLWKGGGFGDWYAPGAVTSIPYIDQCFYANSVNLLIKAADVLAKQQDVETYSALLANVKAAFLKTYIEPGITPDADTQTAWTLALHFDMLPDSMRTAAAARLVGLIHQNKDHLATGFLGTPYLLDVLSDYGYKAVAYTLLNQQTYPSWLYPVKMGATTIWEKWDGIKPDGTVQATSYNHYAYGAVGNWLYTHVAGIIAAAPGYKKIIIKPEIGGGLTWAKASYLSSYGMIHSEWSVVGNELTMKINIPPGTTAKIYIPEQEVKNVRPGTYKYIITVKVKKIK